MEYTRECMTNSTNRGPVCGAGHKPQTQIDQLAGTTGFV